MATPETAVYFACRLDEQELVMIDMINRKKGNLRKLPKHTFKR